MTSRSLAIGDSSYGIVLSDLDRNGTLDLVTSDGIDGHAVVALGSGDGTFGPPTSISIEAPGMNIWGPMRVFAVDLNRDQIPDLVSANTAWGDAGEDTISVLLGVGNGTFSAPVAYNTGLEAGDIATGDFDKDGHVDIVTANRGSGSVSLLRGNSTGTFAPRVDFTTGGGPIGDLGPYSVLATEVTGDGRLDLIVGNGYSLVMLRGLAGGQFSAPVVLLSGSGARADSIAAGDLDHDGQMDLVVGFFLVDAVAVLRGKPGGTFAAPVFYDVFAENGMPYDLVLADVNGDGERDIVTSNDYRQSVTVLLGAGDATFSRQRTFGSDGRAGAIAAGDLNGDGRVDIVARTQDRAITVMFGLEY